MSLSCDSEENESVMREKGSVSIICTIKHDQLPVRGYLYGETPSRDAYCLQSKHAAVFRFTNVYLAQTVISKLHILYGTLSFMGLGAIWKPCIRLYNIVLKV